MNQKSHSDQLEFERSILRFSCYVGAFRMGFELYSDVINDEAVAIFIVNAGIFLVTIISLILSYCTNIKTKYLTSPFISVVSFLLIYNWIISGGFAGVSEYNMFTLILISGMFLKGKFMKGFVLFLILAEIVVILLMDFRIDLFQDVIVKTTIDERYYLLLMPSTTVVFLYLRYRYDKDEDKLLRKIEELKSKADEINAQNKRIEKKKEEYVNVNDYLSRKIQLRKEQLEDRNQSLTGFIQLSLRELYPPLQATVSSLKKVTNEKQKSEIYEMMSKSSDELVKAYQNMTINMRKNLD